MGQEGRPEAPLQRGGVRGAEVLALWGQGPVIASRQRIDAERGAACQRIQLVTLAPDECATEQTAPQLFAVSGGRHVGHHAPGLKADSAGGNRRRRAMLVGGYDGADEVGARHALKALGVAGDLFAHQPLRQRSALLHPDDQERTALVVALEEGQERPSDVAIGEGAGRAGVFAQRQHGVEAGLPIARSEQAAAAQERARVVGQHDLFQLAAGAAMIDRPVPVLAAVIRGGMDEEDVGRPIARRRQQGIARQQRPGGSPRVIRRGGRTVGLIGLPGIQRGAQDLVPEQERGHQHQRQQDAAADLQPGLEGG